MPVTVQLPGYNHNSPLVNALSAINEGANAYKGYKQSQLADTENQEKQAQLSQMQAQSKYVQDLQTPGTAASQDAVRNLANQASLAGDLAEKQGLSRRPFDDLLDVAVNGRPTYKPLAQGEFGPPQEIGRQPLSGFEAQRMNSPLFESLVSMQKPTIAGQSKVEAAKTSSQGKIDAIDEKAKNQPKAAPGTATKDQDKALARVQTLLESARGNPAAAQAERDYYAANKFESLVNLYGDPNKLNPAQVQLAASEVGKIASGGVPTQHELQGLTPNSVPSGLAGLAQRVANHPESAEAGAFVRALGDYVGSLKKDAMNTIQDKYGRIIETNKQALGPNYNTLQDNYINRFSKGSAAPTAAPQGAPTVDPSKMTREQKIKFLQGG